jgi:predicted secreted protein
MNVTRRVGICTVAVLALGGVALTHQPAAAGTVVTVGDASDGKAVTLHPGDTLVVTLRSTAWTIDAAHGAALRTRGEQVVKVDRPGPGAPGSTSRTFVAAARGDATVTASRTTCGEALKCTPAQGAYLLTAHVEAVPVLPHTGWDPEIAALGLLLTVSGGVTLLAGRKRQLSTS